MVHVEFVVLLLLLLWIERQVGRCADARVLSERLDTLERRQTHIGNVLYSGWVETLGVEKADMIRQAAYNYDSTHPWI